MSLLWMEYETDFQDLVNIAFQREQEAAPDYFSKMSDYTRKIVYRDTRYNIDFLYTSYTLKDEKIMTTYAKWLFELLDSVFTENTKEQTANYVVTHFDKISEAVRERIKDPEKQKTMLNLYSFPRKVYEVLHFFLLQNLSEMILFMKKKSRNTWTPFSKRICVRPCL